jgi:hypothetical protein
MYMCMYIQVCVYMYMYVYLSISPQHICICVNVILFDPHIQDFSVMYHTVSTVIIDYRCNKQDSIVQFPRTSRFSTRSSCSSWVLHTSCTLPQSRCFNWLEVVSSLGWLNRITGGKEPPWQRTRNGWERTSNGNVRVFVNSRYLNVIKSGVHQQDRFQQWPFWHLSTWLIVGKIGQGMMFCKCNNNSNVLVCVTLVCVTHTRCVSSWLTSFKMIYGTSQVFSQHQVNHGHCLKYISWFNQVILFALLVEFPDHMPRFWPCEMR